MSQQANSLARTWFDAFRADGSETEVDRYLGRMPGFPTLQSAQQTVAIAWQVVKTAVAHPGATARETIVESSRIFRVAAAPLTFASVVYILAFGPVLFGEVAATLGLADRVGPGMYLGLTRELSTWLTYMILAAIVGAAMAGDLGARRVRQELDALSVLGVDFMRALIVPRVIAITFVGLVLSMFVVLVNVIGTVLADTLTIHQNAWTQVEAIQLSMNHYDLAAIAIKHTVLGFFIGVVASQRGLSARGGAEGVGRVVAETVVVTFFGIWLINSLFNMAFMTVVPSVLDVRG